MNGAVYTLRAESPDSARYGEMAAMLATLGHELTQGCYRMEGDGVEGSRTVWRFVEGESMTGYGIGEAITRGLDCEQADGPQRVIARGFAALREILAWRGDGWQAATPQDCEQAALRVMGLAGKHEEAAAFLLEYRADKCADPEDMSPAACLACGFYNLRRVREMDAELPLLAKIQNGGRIAWVRVGAPDSAWDAAEKYLTR